MPACACPSSAIPTTSAPCACSSVASPAAPSSPSAASGWWKAWARSTACPSRSRAKPDSAAHDLLQGHLEGARLAVAQHTYVHLLPHLEGVEHLAQVQRTAHGLVVDGHDHVAERRLA